MHIWTFKVSWTKSLWQCWELPSLKLSFVDQWYLFITLHTSLNLTSSSSCVQTLCFELYAYMRMTHLSLLFNFKSNFLEKKKLQIQYKLQSFHTSNVNKCLWMDMLSQSLFIIFNIFLLIRTWVIAFRERQFTYWFLDHTHNR